jgi:hypothetical protein
MHICHTKFYCNFIVTSHWQNLLSGIYMLFLYCYVLWGVEYVHRDPASRRRRRKGKSQNWDSKNMVARSKGLGPEKHCAGEDRQHIQKTDPSSRQRGRPTKQDRNSQTIINIWSWAPDGGSTPRLTDWPTVSRNVTLTMTWCCALSFRNVVFFCVLEYWTMDKVQVPSSPECHIPSSEPFKVYLATGLSPSKESNRMLVIKIKKTLDWTRLSLHMRRIYAQIFFAYVEFGFNFVYLQKIIYPTKI